MKVKITYLEQDRFLYELPEKCKSSIIYNTDELHQTCKYRFEEHSVTLKVGNSITYFRRIFIN